MISTRDIELKEDYANKLLIEKHVAYLKKYAEEKDGVEQITSEFLKMSGMYWCLNALYLMKTIDKNSSELDSILRFIQECQCAEGGFGASINHDPHILHTLSAIQILVMMNKCNDKYVDIEKCGQYIKSLQQPDGSFAGDKWGEVDTRFSFCGLATMKLINKLHEIDLDKATDYVFQCHNDIDGGFGSRPGSESHAAYVYCCVGSIAIANKIDKLKNKDLLAEWLSERQLPSGGLNGRPEKLPDLCYSWWCLSSLSMIKAIDSIDKSKLYKFILACQDPELGGFSDRPGNFVDPYHTMFALSSLSLIAYNKQTTEEWNVELRSTLKEINPVLCLPQELM